MGRALVRAGTGLILLVAAAWEASAQSGSVFISGDDSDDRTGSGHCRESRCGRMMGRVLSDLYAGCGPPPAGAGILAVGINHSDAHSALLGDGYDLGWLHEANGGPGSGTPVMPCNSTWCIASVDFDAFRLLYVASSHEETEGGLTQAQLDVLNAREADIRGWVNERRGRVLALTEYGLANAYGWLPSPLTSEPFGPDAADMRRSVNPDTLAPYIEEEFPGNGATDSNVDHVAYHNFFTGPAGWSGLRPMLESVEDLIPDPEEPSSWINAPVAFGCCGCKVTAELCDNGVDDDGDGEIDEADEDCHVCGDGTIDPIDRDGDGVEESVEACDDGNNLDGDGCSADCLLEADTGEGPACALDGPHLLECSGSPLGLPLDGSGSHAPEGGALEYAWSSDCPGAWFDDPASPTPLLTLDGPPPCPLGCTVTLEVVDASGRVDACEAGVSVSDSAAPYFVDPPADLAASCAAVPPVPDVTVSDDCDPAPSVTFEELRSEGACPDAYTLARTWTASDRCGNVRVHTQIVEVRDTTPPAPAAALVPLPSAPAGSAASAAPPGSACSPAASRAFTVSCAAADGCDPEPLLEAALLVTHTEVGAGGACAERVDRVEVACGEVLEIRLQAAPCAASPPGSARSSVSVRSDGVRVVSGEAVELEVLATDRCGNAAAARHDPASEPDPLCEEELEDGSCCPPIGVPSGGPCSEPCGAGIIRGTLAASRRPAECTRTSRSSTSWWRARAPSSTPCSARCARSSSARRGCSTGC